MAATKVSSSHPEPRAFKVRQAYFAELDQLADVFGDAFERDPFNQWICSNALDRRAQLTNLLGGLAERSLISGALVDAIDSVVPATDQRLNVTGAPLTAAALWVPPGVAVPASHDDLRPEVVRAIEGVYALRPRQEHWYLDLLAARVGGNGYGSALLRSRLAKLDEEHMSAALWTTTQSNVRLYQRHGFVITEQIQVTDHLFAWWLLRAAR